MTSNFHLARSQAVFSKCFELANKSQRATQCKLQLSCYGADDDDAMSQEVLCARAEKELQSLKVWFISKCHSKNFATFSKRNG